MLSRDQFMKGLSQGVMQSLMALNNGGCLFFIPNSIETHAVRTWSVTLAWPRVHYSLLVVEDIYFFVFFVVYLHYEI